MKKKMARIFTLVLSLALLVSVCVLSFPALAGQRCRKHGNRYYRGEIQHHRCGRKRIKNFLHR